MPDTRCVYYLRKGNRYKIGYTANLDQRMQVLQPDELLAVEPGGFALEAERHHQFADTRIRGEGTKDWFYGSPQLFAHIAAVAAAHPLPQPSPRPTALPANEALAEFSIEELGAYARKLDAIEEAECAELADDLDELHRGGWSWRKIEAETGIDQVSARRYVRRAVKRRRARTGGVR